MNRAAFLPWISRRAYDLLLDERDRLREQNDALLDHRMRMERVEQGRPETPIPHRQTREPMPDDVRALIYAWDGEATRSQLTNGAYARFEREGSWDGVRQTLEAQATDA